MAGLKQADGTLISASAHPSPSVAVVPLAFRNSTRISAAIGAFLVLIVELLLVGFLALALSADPSLTPAYVAPQLLLIPLIVAVGLGVARLLHAVFMKPPFLQMTQDALEIHNGLLLRSSLRLPLDGIEAISVSTEPGNGWWDPTDFTLYLERRGLTWMAGNDETAAELEWMTYWLIPYLTHDPVLAPNVAILLKDPVNIDAHKRWGWLHMELHAFPIKKAQVAKRAFLLGVRDPTTAQQELARTGLVRQLTAQDAEMIEPTARDVRRLRRAVFLRYALVIYAVLVMANFIADLTRG